MSETRYYIDRRDMETLGRWAAGRPDGFVDRLVAGRGTREDADEAIRIYAQVGMDRAADGLRMQFDFTPAPDQPRRTLADVVANPPEGWSVAWSSREAAHFTHRSGAWLATDTELRDGCERVKGAQTRAAAHRAVADLLDLLAEVSGG